MYQPFRYDPPDGDTPFWILDATRGPEGQPGIDPHAVYGVAWAAAQLPDPSAEMSEMFMHITPSATTTRPYSGLMVASTSSNLGAAVDVLMLAISLDDIRIAPVAEYPEHDVSLETAARAYRSPV